MPRVHWIAALTLVVMMPLLASAEQAETPAQTSKRFLTAASRGDEAALDALMATSDWRETHPVMVWAIKEQRELFGSYLQGGEPALQEVVESSPGTLGVGPLARVMLRSSLTDETRPLYLVWSADRWKVGTATGLLAGVSAGRGDPDSARGYVSAKVALHTLLEGAYLVSLGERHMGETIVASALADTVTDSARQMIISLAESSPYILYSYAAGTTVDEGYENLDPFGFKVSIHHEEPRADGGLRAYAVSSGARQPRAFGLVRRANDLLLVDEFAQLLVGIEKPRSGSW